MIVLTLPYPVSANRYWATRVIKSKATGQWLSMTYVTPEAEAYKQRVAWIAGEAGVKRPLAGRVWVDLRLFPERPQDWARRAQRDPVSWDDRVRCVDLDNARKVAYDAMKHVVFGDDSLVFKESGERMEPDQHGARLVVTIRQIKRAIPQLALLSEDVP